MKFGRALCFYERENFVKAFKRGVDDFVGVRHGGVKTASCKGNDTVCHVRCAHIFHGFCAGFHFGLVFEKSQSGFKEAETAVIEAHCAGAFKVNDAALVVNDVRKIVFFDKGFKACRKSVARNTRFFASVVFFDGFDAAISCVCGQGVRRESAADVRFFCQGPRRPPP